MVNDYNIFNFKKLPILRVGPGHGIIFLQRQDDMYFEMVSYQTLLETIQGVSEDYVLNYIAISLEDVWELKNGKIVSELGEIPRTTISISCVLFDPDSVIDILSDYTRWFDLY
jgi:hypothetical protein